MRKEKPTEKITEEKQIRKKNLIICQIVQKEISLLGKNRTLGVFTFMMLPEHIRVVQKQVF